LKCFQSLRLLAPIDFDNDDSANCLDIDTFLAVITAGNEFDCLAPRATITCGTERPDVAMQICAQFDH
jgi:hypothetical protein